MRRADHGAPAAPHHAASDGASSAAGRLDRRSFLRVVGGAAAVLPLTALTACDGSGRTPGVVRIAFQQFGSGTRIRDWIAEAAEQHTAEHPDQTVELVPIVASENDYFTKNELLMASPRTSPDDVYEDTFILLSDVEAGYLQPIDEFVADWEHWPRIARASREAVKGDDGRTYAVPTHTDTRALWFNKEVLSAAGLAEDWAPRTWDELLDAARTIKQEVPEVAPLFIFSGKAQGEKASMQGFEMLFYGTGDTLHDSETGRWIIGSRGFVDALNFVQTVFEEELTLSLADNLDPNIGETIYTELLPEQKLGILLDGSWVSANWGEGGTRPWPEWSEKLGLAKMPTQRGQGDGSVTLAGGWCLAIPRHATDPKAAFSFIETLCQHDRMVDFTVDNGYITVRSDIAEDPRYAEHSPTAAFFTDLLDSAVYRPALAPYPEISSAIQGAMEQVMTGSATPEQAAAGYDAAVIEIVGPENVQEASA